MHKSFNKPLPYTYLITHIPSGMKYHGGRESAANKNISPIEDLGKKYFGSSTHELFKKNIIKSNLVEYKFEIRWTFDYSEDMWTHENRVNKKIIQRKNYIESTLINKSFWCNKTSSPVVKMVGGSLDRALQSRKEICQCSSIPECNGTLTKDACVGKRVQLNLSNKCMCNQISDCDGTLTVNECNGKKSKLSLEDICHCRAIKECNGKISKKKCIGIKSKLSRLEICDCQLIPECSGTLTKNDCIGIKSKRSRDEKCTCMKHVYCDGTITKQECVGYKTKISRNEICQCSEIPECNGKLTKYECSGIKNADKSVYELFNIKTGDKFKGNQREIKSSLNINDSNLSNLISERIKITGHWCLHKNRNTKLGQGSNSDKQRWWQHFAKQDVDSLTVWKNIEDIFELWIDNNKCGEYKLSKLIKNTYSLSFSQSRCAKLVTEKHGKIGLFKDQLLYEEMLEIHKKTDFDELIRQIEFR